MRVDWVTCCSDSSRFMISLTVTALAIVELLPSMTAFPFTLRDMAALLMMSLIADFY